MNVKLINNLFIHLSFTIVVSSQTTIVNKIVFPIETNVVSNSIQVPPLIFAMRPGLVITGKYLVYIEEKADKIFQVFELPDCKYIGGFGNLGNGPKEFNSVNGRTVTASPKGLIVFDLYEGIRRIDLTNFMNTKDFILTNSVKSPMELQLLNVPFILNDSILCGVPYPHTVKNPRNKSIIDFNERQFIKFNLRSRKIEYFGDYPDLYPKKYYRDFRVTYSGYTAVKPDQQKFAMFAFNIKMFTLYNSNTSLIKQVIMKTQDNFFENGTIRKNAIRFYGLVKATNKYIFAICHNTNLDKIFKEIPTIEIWDWNGNPVALLQLDKPLSAFDITPDNKSLYFIDYMTQDKIFRIDLSKLIK